MASRFIVGLDVGTASVKVVLAERGKDGRPALRLAFKEPTRGLRRGVIVDIADASQGIANALGEVKKIARQALSTVYVSVGTHHVKTHLSRGITAVSRVDTEIYHDDVERVLRASQAVNLEHNRMIMHVVTREFIVDGVGDISDPIGLSGSRLEVSSVVVDAFSPDVKNVVRATELCGGQVAGLVLAPLAAARASVSRSQKDLGVVLVDIGAGTTGMAVYEEHKLLGTVVVPLGAANVTNDIAVGMRISVEAAENVKVSYGYALAREVSSKEMIELKQFIPEGRGAASRRLLAEIIEVRLAEMFEFINNELKLIGKAGGLPGGVVLTGGGAKLPGLAELARGELKLPSQIGAALPKEWAQEKGEYHECFEDPEFATAMGLVLWGADEERWVPKEAHRRPTLRRLLRYFLP